MPDFDERTAECLVFTYKEGLLSAVAHDLKIKVERFTIHVEQEPLSVEGRFDARSLRVQCAMKDGAEAAALLSEGDRRKIEGNIVSEVLHAARHPEVRFTSTRVTPAPDGYEIAGTLTLAGTSREIRFSSRREGERQQASVRIHQPDFGIKPYTAMLGTLRIRPEVTVRISVPAAAGPG